MKSDGLSLLSGSNIDSFTFDPDSQGTEFPDNPTQGTTWTLTVDYNDYIKGDYTFFDGEWKFNGFSNISSYDIVGGCIGLMDDDAVLTRFAVPRTIFIPANAFGAVAGSLTPSTLNTTMFLTVNTGFNINPIGTITFVGGNNSGTVDINTDYAVDGYIRLNRGDILEVMLSGSADATLADVTYTISGFLNF